MPNEEPNELPRNASGQSMRRKGMQTRQRMVEATVELLKTGSLTTLRAADIAALSGTSKPNFYLYFPTVLDAALAAVKSISVDTPQLVAMLEEPWPEDVVLKKAKLFTSTYFKFWAEHSHVLRVRRSMVSDGDVRFAEAERETLLPLVDALAGKIRHAQKKHRQLRTVHPHSAAGAMIAMLERLAGRGPMEANEVGITDDRIVAAIATMMANMLAPLSTTP